MANYAILQGFQNLVGITQILLVVNYQLNNFYNLKFAFITIWLKKCLQGFENLAGKAN